LSVGFAHSDEGLSVTNNLEALVTRVCVGEPTHVRCESGREWAFLHAMVNALCTIDVTAEDMWDWHPCVRQALPWKRDDVPCELTP
jgi:hypothetical protein